MPFSSHHTSVHLNRHCHWHRLEISHLVLYHINQQVSVQYCLRNVVPTQSEHGRVGEHRDTVSLCRCTKGRYVPTRCNGCRFFRQLILLRSCQVVMHIMRNHGYVLAPFQSCCSFFPNPHYLGVASTPCLVSMSPCDVSRTLVNVARLRNESRYFCFRSTHFTRAHCKLYPSLC